MTAPTPYLWLPGNAAEAMHFYKDTFGGSLELHTLADFARTDGPTVTEWFARLAEGGAVIDPLAERGWGATDGQVADRFGVRWLIGYEDDVSLDA